MKFKKLYKSKCYIIVVFLILFFSLSGLLNCVKQNKKNEPVVSKDTLEFKPPPELIHYEIPPEFDYPPKTQEKFKYPDSLKYLGIEGEVILKLHINKQGDVTEVVVEKSLHPALDSIAVRDARTLKFHPGGIKPVACMLLYPVEFKLENK